jgi:hypothetical protein
MRVHISDHALLRYMERRFGIDVDGFRRLLEAEAGHILDAGASVAVVDGLEFIVNPQGTVITTVRPAKSMISRQQCMHKRASMRARR